MRPHEIDPRRKNDEENLIPLYSVRGLAVATARTVFMLSIPAIVLPKGVEEFTGHEASDVFWVALATGAVAYAVDRILCKTR